MYLSRFKYYFFLWVFLLSLSDLIAQNNVHATRITTSDGLSQGAIFDIIQDSEGFMWIATKDGLNRYDGYNFKVFTNDPDDPYSIAGNQVYTLFEDSKGHIWAAVDNYGLSIYNKYTGRFHNILHEPSNPSGISGNTVVQILEDTSDYFILNIDEREINLLTLGEDFFSNRESYEVIRIQMPLAREGSTNAINTPLKGIAQDEKHRVWVGVLHATYQLDAARAKLNFVTDNYSIGQSCKSNHGGIWVGGFNYPLAHWDGQNFDIIKPVLGPISEIHEDQRGQVWMLIPDSIRGIKVLPDRSGEGKQYEKVLYWNPEDIVSTDYPMWSMTFDRSGLMWVGTNGFGIYRLNPNQWKVQHILKGASIRYIVPVSSDEYYINTYNAWFTQSGESREFQPLGPQANPIPLGDLVYSKKNEHFWILESNNQIDRYLLKKLDRQYQEILSVEIPWNHHDNHPIMESKEGVIWMAGFNHILTYFNPNEAIAHSYDLQSGQKIAINNSTEKVFSHARSSALYEDIDGTIWVGSEVGIARCYRAKNKGEKLSIQLFKNIPGDKHSLSYNHVMTFLDDPRDPDQYLWVGTKGGGLNRLNKKTGKFDRISMKNGLPNDVIYGILSDNKRRIWGSTNKGLFCLMDYDVESNHYQIRNFSKQDGLQEDEFNTGAYVKMPDGQLAFGGVNGLNIFNPDDLLSDPYEPKVSLTNILVGNKPVSLNDSTGIIERTIETAEHITLQPHHDILTLEFASLDFTNPEKNKYRYQLIGANDSWVEAGNNRTATFLHLKPKDYTFRVQGSNSQGIWSNNIAELQIKVLPPWWNTWLAYLSYGLVLASAVILYLRFSIRRAKLNQQLDFEKREADRIRELDVQKTQLYMNMTHEFRTPLTIILGMAKQIKEDPKSQLNEGVNMIIRNGQNLLGLVNKMLSLSKLENGKMQLDLVQDDIVVFLRTLSASFSSLVEQKEIQLHYLPEIDSLTTSFDPDKLQQIISNLISNAYKFTPEDGNIYLIVKAQNNSIEIRVKDTGRGISNQNLINVFERFYQADTTTTRQYEGTGIGLALTKELVTLMSGEISVHSPPTGAEVGTEFIIRLPILSELGVPVNSISSKTKPVPSKISTRPELAAMISPEETVKKSIEKPVAENKTLSSELVPDTRPLILLVEDNTDVVAYVASCIRSAGNESARTENQYRLAVAENGQEGLEMAIELIPDLIISDVMMPIMDGFQLLNHIKSDERTNHIPVIILTARADLKSKLEGLEIGANAYLPKPFEKKELLFTIKNLFELRDNVRLQYQQINQTSIPNIESASTSPNPSKKAIEIEDPFVKKVREIIEENISAFDFEVGIISKELHLSHSQLSRKLDALTGYTPNRFIRILKLKKAKEFLSDEQLSITAVAYDCGFSDPSYFSRVFKKEFGMTPGKWRESIIRH